MKKTIGIAILTTVTAIATALWFMETPHTEIISPNGKYHAIVSKRLLFGLLPAFPGQGSDSPGSITIYEITTGKNMGRRKLEMVLMAHDLEWSDNGAKIKSVAYWNF